MKVIKSNYSDTKKKYITVWPRHSSDWDSNVLEGTPLGIVFVLARSVSDFYFFLNVNISHFT